MKEGGRAVEFKYAKRCFEYDVKENVLVQVEEEVHNSPVKRGEVLFGKSSPDGAYVAYVKRHDLYVMRVKDSVETRLTTDGERYFSYGKSDSDTSGNVGTTRAEWFGDSKKMYVIR